MYIVVFENNEPSRGFDEIAEIAEAYYSTGHQLLDSNVKELVSIHGGTVSNHTPDELAEMIEELE